MHPLSQYFKVVAVSQRQELVLHPGEAAESFFRIKLFGLLT